jgi:hypothetical protein
MGRLAPLIDLVVLVFIGWLAVNLFRWIKSVATKKHEEQK